MWLPEHFKYFKLNNNKIFILFTSIVRIIGYNGSVNTAVLLTVTVNRRPVLLLQIAPNCGGFPRFLRLFEVATPDCVWFTHQWNSSGFFRGLAPVWRLSLQILFLLAFPLACLFTAEDITPLCDVTFEGTVS